MRKLFVAVAAFAVAATLGGCGGSDKKEAPKKSPAVSSEQRSVVATIDQLQSATQAGDARKICSELFTQELARSIKAAAKRSCTTEVKAKLISTHERISVGRDIRVKGDRATAVIREQNRNTSTLFLVKRGGRWKIERLSPVQSP
jgi:hypothetical protein